MTHDERMKALVEAGEKAASREWLHEPSDGGDHSVGMGGYSAQVGVVIDDVFVTLFEAHHNEQADEPPASEVCTVRMGKVSRGFGDDNAAFIAQAANARDTIALAAEGMRLLSDYRALTQSDPHPLGGRIDALLAKWGGKVEKPCEYCGSTKPAHTCGGSAPLTPENHMPLALWRMAEQDTEIHRLREALAASEAGAAELRAALEGRAASCEREAQTLTEHYSRCGSEMATARYLQSEAAEIRALLASTDAGERVRAVVQAAREYCKVTSIPGPVSISDAALNGLEDALDAMPTDLEGK